MSSLYIFKAAFICFVLLALSPAFARSNYCEASLGGEGESLPLWERIYQVHGQGVAKSVVLFLRDLAGRPIPHSIRFPEDSPQDLQPRKYGNTIRATATQETDWILEVLGSFQPRVRLADHYKIHGAGHLLTGSTGPDRDLERLNLRWTRSLDPSSPEFVSLNRNPRYEIELLEPLPALAVKELRGNIAQSFRLIHRVRSPEATEAIDKLGRRGRIEISGSSDLQIQVMSLLSRIGLNLEVSQNGRRMKGQLIDWQSNTLFSPLSLTQKTEITTYELIFLKPEAKKIRTCEEQFHRYATFRTFMSHEISERDEYLRLRYLCTDQIEIKAQRSIGVETW